MQSARDIIVCLEKCRENLIEWLRVLNENVLELRTHYIDNFDSYVIYNHRRENVVLREENFQWLIDEDKKYIETQLAFLDDVLNLKILKEEKLSKQMMALIKSFAETMRIHFEEKFHNELIFEIQYKDYFNEEYVGVLLLSNFSEYRQNVVLIGGNGSGKSTLAKTLKGNDTENISVIPAQKSLYFSLRDTSMLTTRVKDLKSLLLENNIRKSKEDDDYDYFEFQNNQFTKLIIAMREQFFGYLVQCEERGVTAEKDSSIFGCLRRIFGKLFPEIILHCNSKTSDYLSCEKQGESYSLNALSEGEKAVIYYCISTLMAKEDSFIIVDEPETYLNPSLASLLWDLLIKERSDCQFIFITHSVDFVLSRDDSQIAWIKSFDYPNSWDFEFVEDGSMLPKTMLTEMLGSQKPVLFCEGNDKTSIDYVVYRALLGENFTILPVGGHLEVIKYCDVISSTKGITIECKGIIDGDNATIEKVDKLEEKNIHVLPFNEIEMLLLSDEVMQSTMNNIFPEDAEDRILKFKNEFWKRIKEQKNRVALTKTKNEVDEYIQNQRIDGYKDLGEIKDNISRLSNYDVTGIYDKCIQNIDDIIVEENYGELLRICNLKEEIIYGLGNKFLDSYYKDKAIQQIKTNKELRDMLLKKYFDI